MEKLFFKGLLERIAEANKLVFKQQGNERLTPGSLYQPGSMLQPPYVSVANCLNDECDVFSYDEFEGNCSY